MPLHDARRGLYGSFSVISFGDRGEFDTWYSGARGMLAASAYCFPPHVGRGREHVEGIGIAADPARTRVPHIRGERLLQQEDRLSA